MQKYWIKSRYDNTLMIALRLVMRLAWQIANPIELGRSETAFPFGVLTEAAPGGGGEEEN